MRKNRLRKERRKEQNESEEKFEKKNLRQIVSIEGKGGSQWWGAALSHAFPYYFNTVAFRMRTSSIGRS